MEVREEMVKLETLSSHQLMDVVKQQADIIFQLAAERDHLRNQVLGVREVVVRNQCLDVTEHVKDNAALTMIRTLLYGH